MAEPTERGDLTVAIDDALRGVVMALKRGHPHGPADLDLTLAHLHCLRTVNELGEPSMSELSAALGLSPSTVTGLVDTLTDGGQLVRRHDPLDRRVVRVRLSAAGRRRRERHTKLIQQRLSDLLSDLSVDELQRVAAALDLLLAAVQRRAGEAAT